jgi:hypothetical protein
MLWPSRYAATENSIGMVGTLIGSAPTSISLRPFVKTSATIDGSTMRGSTSWRIIHW